MKHIIKMQYGNIIYEKTHFTAKIKVISKCISFNRFETYKILNGMILFSLKRKF